jgi:5-methylcytosine-specific restriction endonuclease McrA
MRNDSMAPADCTRPIITRAEAKRLGLKRYFPGSTCKHGHTTERATVNGLCLECARLKGIATYYANREADLARQKLYRAAHPDLKARQKAKRHAENPAMAYRLQLGAADHLARAEAQSQSLTMYESPRSCQKCGTARRFAADGKCVECNRLACNQRAAERRAANPAKVRQIAEKRIVAKVRREKKEKTSAAAGIIRQARQGALARGDLTYIGRQCPKGHDGVRYTRSGGCLACCADISASEEKKRYDAEYLKKNADRIRETHRKYLATKPGYASQKAKEWVARNPEKRRTISQHYKHKRRAQEAVGMTWAELHAWKKVAKKVCYWCGKKCPKAYCVDHYEPLSKGGKHEASNLVIACRSCNSRKSAKDPEQFRAETWHGTLFSSLINP